MSLYPLDLQDLQPTELTSSLSAVIVHSVLQDKPTKILSVNKNRTSFLVVNTSTANCFLGFTNQVSSAVYTFAVPKNSYFEFSTQYRWIGEVWVIGSANCNITVTEISK